MIASRYRVRKEVVVLFGFKTQFGGMRSTGYCLIYDNLDYLKKYEPRHRKLAVFCYKIFFTFNRGEWRNMH